MDDRANAIRRHEDRVRRPVRREELVGLMNAPKWRRLVTALAPFALRYRRKLVDDLEPEGWGHWLDLPSPSSIDSAFGPVRSFEIEWLEVGPANGDARQRIAVGAILSMLESLRVPFEVNGEIVRVVGYRRPGGDAGWSSSCE